MTLVKVCKRHKKSPVLIYLPCIGCEVEHLRAEIGRLTKQAQKNLEQTIPTGGDYVCSECLLGHHDNCLGESEDQCDCVTCYRNDIKGLKDIISAK